MNRNKKKKSSLEQNVILSEELLQSLGGGSDLVLESKRKSKEDKKLERLRAEKKKEKEERKGKRAMKREEIARKKQRKIDHDVLMEEISKKQLSADKLTVFKSSGTIGKKETKKEKVRHAFYKEKLGLQLNEEEQSILHVTAQPEENKQEMDVDIHVSDNDSVSQPSEDNQEIVENQMEQKQPSQSVEPPQIESDSDDAPKGPSYLEAIQELQNPTPAGITLRMNDDSIEDMQRLKDDLSTAIPEELRKKAYYVDVRRSEKIQQQRQNLPVCGMEQEIMEAINYHDIVIICGETGSGKTTQVPQFLYEAGYGCAESGHPGMIGVTQPRRVAAVSMARRVAEEVGSECGKEGKVGYQIRYDSHTVGPDCKIKFMTDGILLKEIQSDFLLRMYSAIIIDEAHERNLNTDILLGLLSRIIPLRKQLKEEGKVTSSLKLIIMSATLKVADFKNPILFPSPPPDIHVQARQFPVGVHFAKRTEMVDYLGAAYKKVVQIHKRLPEGGILVFLTGQQEIETLCKRLNDKFSPAAIAKRKKELEAEEAASSKNETPTEKETPEPNVFVPPKTATGEEDVTVDGLAGFSDEEEGEEELDEIREKVEEMKGPDAFYDDIDMNTTPMHVLPLYSLLDEKKQLRVWDPVPEGQRMVVVATNVAETSITIPNIKYVVDSGRAKEKVWEKETGICEYKIQWISQASAEQRQGRAGRVAPGHCYRLYSAAVFQQQFPVWDVPEICRTPLEDTVLLMKNMGIKNIETFPFPSLPENGSISAAIEILKALGALNPRTKEISNLGKEMMKYPVGVRFAKMLVLAKDKKEVLPFVIGVICALTGRSPIIRPEELLMRGKSKEEEDKKMEEEEREEEEEEEKDDKESKEEESSEIKACRESLLMWRDSTSDPLSYLRLFGAYLHSKNPSDFCKQYYLREKTMKEMVELRKQIHRILLDEEASLSTVLNKPLMPPSGTQAGVVRQIVAASYLDHVARKMTPSEMRDVDLPRGKVPYVTTSLNSATPAFIHRDSFVLPLKTSDFDKYPDLFVFQDLVQKNGRVYLRGVTTINKQWLPRLANDNPVCVFSEPLETPSPFFDEKKDCMMCYVIPRYGPHLWEMPAYLMKYPLHDQNVYKWFAKQLLEGKVVSFFGLITTFYSSSPSMLTKPQLPIKAMALINALKKEQCVTKKQLIQCWKKSDSFLRNELNAWILPRYQKILDLAWKYIIKGVDVPPALIAQLKQQYNF